ncbi:ABC transporter permease [Paenibacillus thermoaerophilus]|uniref:ABC transporter permease n=1 Tax=Paenibacillus thermoaerophilus TaxID=1215385 RepID=A0ABW2UX55_9BACL|nr:ABC transporter permease [Paenibacillus thermoaerophilus]TMV17362.1 ABC transporter permease [Paenibacillus thermoaerophilus]
MYAWLTITGCELLKTARSRTVLVMLFGLPLLLIYILGQVFGSVTSAPARVAVYVEDNGPLRGQIESFWNREDLRAYVRPVWRTSAREVELEVKEGTADYGVVVPAGFSDRVASGGKAEWLAYPGRHEDRNIAARAVASRFLSELNVRLAAIAAYGPEAGPLPSAEADEDIPLVAAVLADAPPGDDALFKGLSAMQYYSAAYLIMFLLFSGMSAGIELLRSRQDGTLSRLYATPHPLPVVIGGWIGSSLALAIVQSAFIVTVTSFAFGVDWGGKFGWIALVCLLTAVASIGLALIVASFARTIQSMQTVYNILTFAMTFVSGGMVVGMGGVIEKLGHWTVNHWANEALRGIMNGETASLGTNVGILSLIAAGLAALTAIRMRKVVDLHA